MSSWEWGICLTSLILCWWKYGWSLQVTGRSLRQVYKKFEHILTTHSLEPRPSTPRRKRHRTNFLSIPVTRTQFIKRNYMDHDTNSAKTTVPNDVECSFYKSLPLVHGPSSDGDNSSSSTSSDSTLSCSACVARDEKEKLDHTEDMKNCLEYDTQGPHNPWYIRKFANFIYFWKKWYIGPQYHMVSMKDMVEDERVNQAILDAAKHDLKENPRSGTLDVLVQKHRLRAEKLIVEMRAKQPKHPYFSLYARFASWIIGKTLQRIYPSIFVRQSQLDVIRKARETGHPILYLPIHRSHVDYVLVSWVLVASDIRSPVVAAGDNLNIPVFHMMMRSVGGFFIKRRLERSDAPRDLLYRAILHSYMERSLVDDNDLEFFIEGGRTRTGKPCIPKGGLLSIAMDTLLSRKVDDILIVPVNFSYDKLLEGSYIREQLGKTKVKESFLTAALGLWNSIQTKFGNARIDFGQPFSVKEFIHCYKQWKTPSSLQIYSCESGLSDTDQNNNEDPALPNSDLGIEDRRDFISNLAQHVIYDGVKNLSLMSTNIIAFLLLNKFREGVTTEVLLEELEILQAELHARNHDLSINKDMKEVIKHGLTILGPSLVRRELIRVESPKSVRQTQMFLKPVTSLPNVLELAYYSTCVVPIYAMEAVIATSLLVLKGRELFDLQTVPGSLCHVTDIELISTCLELCGILQNEFIFHPPCQTLEYTIRKSLDDLKTQGIVKYDRSRLYAENGDGDFSFRSIDLIYVNKGEETYQRLKFLHGLIAPLLDTYAVSALVLTRLVGCEAMEKHLQMDMLAEVKCHLQQHFIKYGESLALDPIRNFIKLLLGWQVLEPTNQNYLTTYVLTEAFDLDDSVDTVIRRVKRFQV